MDDYTWKKKLQARRRRVLQERLALVLLFALVLGSVLWYGVFYARTPEYAVKESVRALEEHDAEAFQKYVDLDRVLSHAYDDLTVDLFRHDDSLSPQTRELFENFYVLIKPQVMGGTAKIVLGLVEGKPWEMPGGLDILKGRQLGLDYEEFLVRSLAPSTTLQEVGEVSRTGDGAVVRVQVREEMSRIAFSLELALEEAEDGHWRIVQAKNYRAYLDAVSPALAKDIAGYVEATAGIVGRFNETLAEQQRVFRRMGGSSSGILGASQREGIAGYLENDVIPLLRSRQEELDEIPVPSGATRLAKLRHESTELSLRSWQHYARALREDSVPEYETAESLHKQMLAAEQRIDDIIRHAAVNKEVPNMP